MVTLDYIPSKRKGKLIIDDADLFDIIRNEFSSLVNTSFHPNEKLRNKSIREYAIGSSGLFDFGLYNEIRKACIQYQVTDITYTDTFKSELVSDIKFEDLYDGFSYPHRDFQLECVKRCLTYGRGTIEIGTGGGKSFITASLIENFRLCKSGKKMFAVVVVPGTTLVSQLQKDFLDYKVPFTYDYWGVDKPLNYDVDVIIVNNEYVIGHYLDDTQFVKKVDLLIVDECHKCKKANQISKFASKVHTKHKFGFTGTLPKENKDRWKILGLYGTLVVKKNSKELRDEEYLCDVSISAIQLIHPRKRLSYKNELDYLYTLDARNSLIKKVTDKLSKNTLILVNHIIHGESLLDKFSDAKYGGRVYFISGDTPLDDRLKVIADMEVRYDMVVIAMSSIFSTGINIKNLHNILFVAGGKSFIRIVQSIGRGLRLHKLKNKLTIIDIYDNLRYSSNHFASRSQIYDEEQIPWKTVEYKL